MSSAEAIPAGSNSDQSAVTHKQLHRRRISDSDENCQGIEAAVSSNTPGQHGLGKKTPLKQLWRIVSSSDEEADTLKDRFWRNLEAGILPDDLVGGDLYSSVCMQELTTLLLAVNTT